MLIKVLYQKIRIISEGNRGLHKEMESTRNSNYMGKYIKYFSYYLNLFKINLTTYTKITTM